MTHHDASRDAQEILNEERAAVRQALEDDAWLGHSEPLTADDLDRIAEVAVNALRQVDEDCPCGWGGVHDRDNPRCARNQAARH